MTFGPRASSITALCFLLVACDSSESGDAGGSDSPIVGTWDLVGFERKSGDEAEFTVPADADCVLDGVEEYAADGRWTLYPGEVLCEGETLPTTIRGNWRLEASDTKIVYTYDDFEGEYFATVESLTDAELIFVEAELDLDKSQHRKTFAKQ